MIQALPVSSIHTFWLAFTIKQWFNIFWICYLFNRVKFNKAGDAWQPVPMRERPHVESNTGATGLRTNITQLLRWGVAHLPDQTVGGKVLREAFEMTGQVLLITQSSTCYIFLFCFSSFSAITHKNGQG